MLFRLIRFIKAMVKRLTTGKSADAFAAIQEKLERNLGRLCKERVAIVQKLRKQVDKKKLDEARSSISGL